MTEVRCAPKGALDMIICMLSVLWTPFQSASVSLDQFNVNSSIIEECICSSARFQVIVLSSCIGSGKSNKVARGVSWENSHGSGRLLVSCG